MITIVTLGWTWQDTIVRTARAEVIGAANPLPAPPARNKYALLVGVSNYARGNTAKDFDWWNLHTSGDVQILAEVLIRKFEFKPENIKILADEPVIVDGKTIPPTKPTHAAIRDAFKASLIDKAGKGDIIYFHFSGHGEQVPDDNGDEADGMDETIIPADYVSQKDASNNVRDDEIGTWLDALSKKDPANVTITLDSCFSGTATRGSDVARGGPWKGDPINKKFDGKADDSIGDFVTRGTGSRGGTNGEQKYVFISAASPHQTAKETSQETGRYGAFSYAFAKALENANKTTTYRDLFEGITNLISRTQRDQSPQIEGNQLDKIIMEEGAIPTQQFIPLQVYGSNAYLKAGKLQGMTKGSKFALCPAGAKEYKPGTEIAMAEISQVNPMSAPLTIMGTVDPEKLKLAARAFEVSHSYEDVFKVAVAEQTTRGGTAFDDLFKSLSLAARVPATGDAWNVLIRPPNADDIKDGVVQADYKGYILQRHDGSVLAKVADGDGMAENLKNALKAEATWQLVKSLDDNNNKDLQVVQLTMVPVKVDQDPVTGEALGVNDLKGGFADMGGKKQVHACVKDAETKHCMPNTGDFVRLEIKNTGTKPVFVTILNLRTDGKIGPAFPIGNTDNEIAPGMTFKVPDSFQMSEPFGEESFRAIVTSVKTDFTPLIDASLLSRGPQTDGERNALSSPLGMIFQNAASGKRGDPVAAPASWATSTVTYFIVPPVKN